MGGSFARVASGARQLFVLSPRLLKPLRAAPPLALGIGLGLALATYHPTDPSLNTASFGVARNLMGGSGALAADLLLQGVGLSACVLPILLTAAGIDRLIEPRPPRLSASIVRALLGILGMLLISGALAALPAPRIWPLECGIGGVSGDDLLSAAREGLSRLGVVRQAGSAAAALGVFGLASGAMALRLFGGRSHQKAPSLAPDSAKPRRPKSGRVRIALQPSADAVPHFAQDATAQDLDAAPEIRTPRAAPRQSNREAREQQPALPFAEPGFRLPELAMLAKSVAREAGFDEANLRQNARLLEEVLADFGVRGQIDNIRPGPVVTLYELVPAAGVKSARVVALSDDIARSMSVAACRVSVVAGRNAIGIELPNAKRETVYLRDLLSSAEYEKAGQVLPLALGETIGGEPYIADLSRMPHLLIAGTTGSGKSVGVNAMILSILYRLPPEKCRFIMIDPKMLELSVYEGIPHLLAPVVTDMKQAAHALSWCVGEMERRYKVMSKLGVRNLASYNARMAEAAQRGEHVPNPLSLTPENPEPLQHMPYVVVIIDELADLMMVVGKKIEELIARLAQKARAAGIHLILATQRPSVDVITGLIKANIPTRMAFQVSSKIDSRTILDQMGAESLLGMGDMLYLPPGSGVPQRVHGAFVSDAEVHRVVEQLKAQGEPDYVPGLLEPESGEDGAEAGFDGATGSDAEADPLYDQAVQIVLQSRKASISLVQRHLRIGYNRSARLLDQMEKAGLVSPLSTNGNRDILVPVRAES